jgi:hypothetical protein
MPKAKRSPTPTSSQANWLRRIAFSPMMITRTPGENDRYSLSNGAVINERTAKILIRNGWVVAQRDGLPWLGDLPQTYRVRGFAQSDNNPAA